MGYTTEFKGRFEFDKELTEEQFRILNEFSEERRGDNYSKYPEFPSFYCQWVPTEDRKGLEWDGNEKFYEYIEWLHILIEKFFNPWGIKLNGEVKWRGEHWIDIGVIKITNNKVKAKEKR